MPSRGARLLTWVRQGPRWERLAAVGCLVVLLSMTAPWTNSSTFSILDTGSQYWTEASETATTGPSGAGWIVVVAMILALLVLWRVAMRHSPASTNEALLIGLLGAVEIAGAVAFTVNYYSFWTGTGAYVLDTVGWGVAACFIGGALTMLAAFLMWRRAKSPRRKRLQAQGN
jgi:hypothetical protein